MAFEIFDKLKVQTKKSAELCHKFSNMQRNRELYNFIIFAPFKYTAPQKATVKKKLVTGTLVSQEADLLQITDRG